MEAFSLEAKSQRSVYSLRETSSIAGEARVVPTGADTLARMRTGAVEAQRGLVAFQVARERPETRTFTNLDVTRGRVAPPDVDEASDGSRQLDVSLALVSVQEQAETRDAGALRAADRQIQASFTARAALALILRLLLLPTTFT